MTDGGRVTAGDHFPAIRGGSNIQVSAGGGATGLALYNAATTAAAQGTLGFGAFGSFFIAAAATALAQNMLALGSANSVTFNTATLNTLTVTTVNGSSTITMRTGLSVGNQLNIDVRNTSASAYDRVLACSAGPSPTADLGRFVTIGGETIISVSAGATAARAQLFTPGTITTGISGASQILNIVTLTSGNYASIASASPSTLYVVTG